MTQQSDDILLKQCRDRLARAEAERRWWQCAAWLAMAVIYALQFEVL